MTISTDVNKVYLSRIGLATNTQEIVVEWNGHNVELVEPNHCRCYFIPPHMQEHIRTHCGNHLPEYEAALYQGHFHKAADFRRVRNEHALHLRHAEHEAVDHQISGHTTVNGDTIQKIYDARNRTSLPGRVVKDMTSSTKSASTDVTVNRAFDATKKTYDFYLKVFNRNSIDGKGMQLLSTVHFDRNYDNAFWNGEQMVYGDGDQTIFRDFTLDLDVPGHEMTHGVTERTLALEYANQAGALNEHISDAFGSMIKQYSLKQTVDQANWLIGDKVLVGPGALRSMKAPGTAYDTPVLGKDPQPGKMSGYVQMPNDDDHDNGGVHVNSGIPNHAFYLVCTALGGNSWDKAGKIWYRTLYDTHLKPNANFVDFANSTINSAKSLAKEHSDWTGNEFNAVVNAWKQVEVL